MQKQQEDMKNSMLSQLLDQDARARLNTVESFLNYLLKLLESKYNLIIHSSISAQN